MSISLKSPSVTVSGFLDQTLEKCYRQGASDLHFEPYDKGYRLRCRVNGSLYSLAQLTTDSAVGVLSRIKLLAKLDPANNRTPQDGRFSFVSEEHSVDVRVSSLPLVEGESITLRFLDPLRIRYTLDSLGMPLPVLDHVRRTLETDYGMLVVCGPTGSGKTTTLYACLEALERKSRKVLTAEDPVEYRLDHTIQVPVSPVAGLSYSLILRAFLRQDPDVILVGEIRDGETAATTFQAALTGHLVLSSLHAADCVQGIIRLQGLGVSSSLVASGLTHLMSQRLVRKLCPACRQEIKQAEVPSFSSDSLRSAWNAVGCVQCFASGYRDRIGLFESVVFTPELREAIVAQCTNEELRRICFGSASGLAFRDSARMLIEAGVTTSEEVHRCL
ncbi:MAG: type II/IV secretion system protein [Opitutales bacterium]|nr:type II/IV secretion system protein [Opitutales bacterium]